MKLDRFEVMSREDGSIYRLGSAPFYSTYKALDVNLRTPVVLRVLRKDDPQSNDVRERFIANAKTAAQLRHPHVAQVFHLGEDDGTTFYAREFVEGEAIDE